MKQFLLILKWLDFARKWIARRYLRKGIEAGKAQQLADDAVRIAQQEKEKRKVLVKKVLDKLHQAQREEAEWKKRHKF